MQNRCFCPVFCLKNLQNTVFLQVFLEFFGFRLQTTQDFMQYFSTKRTKTRWRLFTLQIFHFLKYMNFNKKNIPLEKQIDKVP